MFSQLENASSVAQQLAGPDARNHAQRGPYTAEHAADVSGTTRQRQAKRL
jgi:hypothetical protein